KKEKGPEKDIEKAIEVEKKEQVEEPVEKQIEELPIKEDKKEKGPEKDIEKVATREEKEEEETKPTPTLEKEEIISDLLLDIDKNFYDDIIKKSKVEYEKKKKEVLKRRKEKAVKPLDLKFNSQLRKITKNHDPLVQEFKNMQKTGELNKIEDLAFMNFKKLRKLIDEKGIPEGIEGENKEDKKENYFNFVVNTIERISPNQTFKRKLSEDNVREKIEWEGLKEFLNKNPDINPTNPKFDKVDWGERNFEKRKEIKASIKNFSKEIRKYPEFNYNLLLKGKDLDFKNKIREDVEKFLSNSPTFSFQRTNIDQYLKMNEQTAFTGITKEEDRKKLKNQLKLFQRLFRITPKYEEINLFAGEGLHSAYSLARMPESTFVKKFASKLNGVKNAEKIYRKATHISAEALAIFTKYAPLFNSFNPRVIPSKDKLYRTNKEYPLPNTDGGELFVPNIDTLFPGYLDLCDCKHCSSVYSPSAYFVDLMQFLDDIQLDSGETVLDVLLRRRPDLEYIELSCENANKTMPYIDLTNEILENAISPPIYDSNFRIKSEGTSEELNANPEYINIAAYQQLNGPNNVYPFDMPFNFWGEEIRIYLDHLGTNLHEIMEIYNLDELISECDLASEYLKITEEEKKIICGIKYPFAPMRGIKRYYRIVDLTGIGNVSTLLRKTKITYDELIELLNTKFINPNPNNLDVELESIEEGINNCDLDKIILTLKEGVTLVSILDKMHRFIRLWRKVDLSIKELDNVISGLGFSEINEEVLIVLAYIIRTQTELKIPLIKLLSFWGNMDPDLYEDTFCNRAMKNPSIEDKFVLNDEKTQLYLIEEAANENEKFLFNYIPDIITALRISNTELTNLMNYEGMDDSTILNLENLSYLYRNVVLCKALGLSMDDYITLRYLIDGNNRNNLFDPGNVKNVLIFNEKVRKVSNSLFSTNELDYLIRNHSGTFKLVCPSEERVSLMLTEIRDGLKEIANLNGFGTDNYRIASEIFIKWRFSNYLELDPTITNLLVNSLKIGEDQLIATIYFLNEEFV
ncbi:MAG: Tc toxin subunit A, partial [Promethearchaeota archaeon]